MSVAIALVLLVATSGRAAELGLRRQTYTVSARESLTLQVLGATAAWAIDPAVADVAVQPNAVVLQGRSGGRTSIIVVTPAGESTFDVIVRAPAGVAAAPKQSDRGVVETRYASAARELDQRVTLTRASAKRTTELDVQAVRYGADAPGDRAQTALPSVSYRIFTPNREITFLDREVDHSPLTLDAATIRGIHYLDERWAFHAGTTAYTSQRSFLIPVERRSVAAAAYRFPLRGGATLTTGLFAVGGEGAIASLLYGVDRGERLNARFELGAGHGIGAAGQLSMLTPHDRVRADVRYRDDRFPIAAPGDVRGLLADAAWTHLTARGGTAAFAVSATDSATIRHRALAASADYEHPVTRRLALTGGASWGDFDGVQSLTIPAGFRYEFGRAGFGALVRYAENAATNRGGFGGRVFAHASFRAFYVSAYADRQRNAPTLDLIFRERPDLAIALAELGITATSAADIARALRDNAALIQLGYIDGVTLDLAPVRTQAGLDVAWRSGGNELRARLLRNDVESVGSESVTTIATLRYTRRVSPVTELFAGYSYWRTERRGFDPLVQPFVEVGLRHRFDALPSFGAGGVITGVVFLDEDLDGASDGHGVANAEVELDGTSRTQTKADGSFAFRNVTRGTHQVAVRLADAQAAYFTTPSKVEAESGERVAFGVATLPARLFGHVTSDAGDGVAGVRVRLLRGAKELTAATGSDGSYSFVAPPGEWTLALAVESIPPGYASAVEDRSVLLDRTTPQRADFAIRALRTASGRAAPNAEVAVSPGGRTVRADAEGKFSLRSLAAGELTLVSRGVSRKLVLPHEPATLTVDFVHAPEPAPAIALQEVGEARGTMQWVVQLGAYRVHANAVDTVEQARRAGVDATIRDSGSLDLVRTPPFGSRDAADATAQQLSRAGIEAVVLPVR